MWRNIFLLREETKKIFRSRYLFIYLLVLLLDIGTFISEYSDRSRSVLYSTGVHVDGQGLKYLTSHEYGSFGVLVLFLLPLLFTSAPIFSDEAENNMVSQIKVTVNGRIVDTIIKTIIVLMIHFVWTIIISVVSVILSFTLFDKGIILNKDNISQILSCMLNIWAGSFFMACFFLLISSCLKRTVEALSVGIASIFLPMFAESEKILTQLFPVFGMQAECLIKRSVQENIFVFSFYIITGTALLLGNLYYNKIV